MSASKQESSCTLCKFKSDNETAFNQHVLQAHKIILKSARNSIDYKLANRTPREISKKFSCQRCHKSFPVAYRLKDHKVSCEQKFKDIVMNRLKLGQLTCLYCSDIFNSKEQLDKHLKTCSKPTLINCQLCPYKCSSKFISLMQSHILNVHSLICNPVHEPDFLQAVNCTPYTLERAPVVDALPSMTEAQAKLLKRCWHCEMQFSSFSELNNHRRSKECCL